MKRLLFLFLLLPFVFCAGPLQRAHLAVIAGNTVASGGAGQFSFIASASNGSSGSGTTLNTASTLNVQAGDVLIVSTGWEDVESTISVSDGGSNSFSMQSTFDDTYNYVATGVITSASANSSATFTQTLGTTAGYRSIIVLQFRPSGGSISVDGAVTTNNGNSASVTSGSITTSGDYEIVVVAIKQYYQGEATNVEIAGVAADGLIEGTALTQGGAQTFYRILSSTISSATATCDIYASTQWAVQTISVKAE
jgi:hypothetical protein